MPALAHRYFGAMHQSLSLQYAPCNCEACQEARLSGVAPLSLGEGQGERITKVAHRAFDYLYKKGSYKPEDLTKYKAYRDLITATAEVFNTAIPHEVPDEMRAYLEKDVFIFSGLKTHTQLTEARSKLKDEQGNVRPYYQFEQEILKLNNTYNRNYLEAEYQFAVQSTQSAANWANLQEDTSRYWLEYRTAGDERVRQSHAALAGICLPKDDAFWTEYYPPNGWRCRCTAVEVLARENTKSNPETAKKAGEVATTQIGKSGKNKLEMFRFNPGQEKKVFPPTNTYTQVVGATLAASTLAIEAKKIAELDKLKAPYKEAYKAKNGATVKISPFADKNDLNKNLTSAKTIAHNLGVSVNIRPHLNIEKYKNPEYEIKGILADRKESISYTGIKKNLEYAKAQGVGSIVYDITDFKDWLATDITKHLKGKIMNYKGADFLKEMYFINGNKVISFTKEELLNDYLKVVEKLKLLK